MPRKYVKKADREKQAATSAVEQVGQIPPPPPVPQLPRGLMPQPHEMGQMRDLIGVLEQAGVLDERLRGQPAKAMALGMKGWELGLPLMQALEGLYIADDGKIAMQADLMRAMVQRSGIGVVIPIETTNDGALVEAIRYGVAGRPDKVARFSFTLQDAERAGLAHTTSWRKWPGMLCLARATSYACRTVFPDVLAGVSYTPEELAITQHTASAPAAAPTPADPAPAEPVQQEGGEAQGAVTTETQATEPAVSASSPPAPASPEPTPEPEPAPEPARPTPPRPLTHSFQVEGPGGTPKVVRTSGITRDQLVAVTQLTTPKGGNPRWRELQNVGRAFLQQHQLTDLMYLTAAEGDELVALLQQWDQVTPTNPDGLSRTASPAPAMTAKTPQAKLEEFLHEAGLSAYAAQVNLLICRQHQVGSLDQLGRLTAEQAVAEVRDLARDRDAFVLMLERALQEGSVG